MGRKKFRGNRARWAGDLAAYVWSFVETARQHGWNLLAELTRYFEACAAVGGQPPIGANLTGRRLPLESTFTWSLMEGFRPRPRGGSPIGQIHHPPHDDR
jgi:hypothetical protein